MIGAAREALSRSPGPNQRTRMEAPVARTYPTSVPHPNTADVARFLSRVRKTRRCWLWLGSPNNTGYGTFGFAGLRGGAHCASWLFFRGRIPRGLCVLHKCDVRRCVRPGHLFLGTHLDNSSDMKAKGRSATGDRNGMRTHPERHHHGPNLLISGERHYKARLTNEQVVAIRASTDTTAALSREYRVREGTIRFVRIRHTWKHIP